MAFFKRNKRAWIKMDGVVTFYGAHHALKGESVLKKCRIPARLIPSPKEISPNCGTALRFDYQCREKLGDLLKDASVEFEGIHYYPAEGGRRG